MPSVPTQPSPLSLQAKPGAVGRQLWDITVLAISARVAKLSHSGRVESSKNDKAFHAKFNRKFL